MKKASKAFFSVVIMLTLAILSSTAASAASSTTKTSVYNYLTEKIGFNSAAACGIMANIEQESNFNPSAVERDSNGLLSGGLCQWNGSRFTNLKNYCSRNGYNYLSTQGQLEYLNYELQKSQYKHIYNYLKGVSNTAEGAYDAAYYWCYYFEIPASRASKSVTRGNKAKTTYWNQYGEKKLSSIKLSSTDSGKTLDMNDSIKLTWNSAGSSVKSYTLYLAKYENGEYNWKKAKKISLSSDCKSYVLKLSGKDEGNYKVYVLAKSASDSKKSGTVKFTVKCLEHDYTCKVIKEATETSSGTKQYTCKKCGNKYQKSIPAVTTETKAALKITKLSVVSAATSKISLKLSSTNTADGYEVYKYTGSKWVKAAESSSNKITLSGLKAGKTYKLKVRATSTDDGSTKKSEFKYLEVATAPESTYIKSIFRPAVGTATVNFEKVSGASGYIIYAASSKDGKYKKVATASANETKCKIQNLSGGKTYYFKIKAYRKAADNTAYSSFSNSKYIIAK